MGFDERAMGALTQKLESLSYTEHVDVTSGALVSRLLSDLLHMQDSLVTMKHQTGKHANDLTLFDGKMDAVKQDGARLQSENSKLHVMLITEAEKFDAAEKAHYQTAKRLEDRISELSFWKHSASERMAALERENAALRRKVSELTQMSEQVASGASDPFIATAKMAMSSPLKGVVTSGLPPPRSPARASVDALQASNSRILSLQRQLAERSSDMLTQQQQVADLKDAVSRRDAEISRLGTRAGTDHAVVGILSRNDANENMILQLNQSVDMLREQVRDQEAALIDKHRVEMSFQAAERAQKDAERKLKEALGENGAIEREVIRLRNDLCTLRASADMAANQMAAAEVDTALTSVSALRQRLSEVRQEQDSLCASLANASREREQAQSAAAVTTRELEALRGAVDECSARADEFQRQAVKLKGETASLTKTLREAESALLETEQRLSEASDELAARRAAADRLDRERAQALGRLDELQRRLESVETAARTEHASNVSLTARLSKAESELRTASSSSTALGSEVQSLREQLKEANDVRLRTSSALGSTEDERSRLHRELSSLKQQLSQERAQVEGLTQARSNLQVEVSRLQTELSGTCGERDLLSAKLTDVSARLSEEQSAHSNKALELSGMKGMPTRVGELQDSVREYVTKLAAAEGEVERLRSELLRCTDSAARVESEREQLRHVLSSERDAATRLRLQLVEAEQGGAAAGSAAKALEAEKMRLLADSRSSGSELASLQSRLQKETELYRLSDATVNELRLGLTAVQRQLASKEDELASQQRAFDQLMASADGVRLREEEARGQGRDAAERARRAGALNAEYEADLAQMMAVKESDGAHIRALEENVSQLRGELDARRSEVEQLTTLSLRGDATVQEYMSSLKAMSLDLRAAEMRVSDLVAELSNRDDLAHRNQLDQNELRRVVQALDGERDSIQSELDMRAEQMAMMTHELDSCKRQVEETSRLLAMAEGRLTHADSRAREGDCEVGTLRDQLATTLDNLRGLSDEHEAVREELRAVTEDLEALVKENQVVSNELAVVTQQRDGSSDELRRAFARLASSESMVRGKEVEVEDLRRAYEALAVESRRFQSSVTQLEREAALREAALKNRADEVSSLTGANREGQSQVNQYVMDLQAFERQVDSLSRQLAKCENDAEEMARDREVQLEEIRAAQQVRMGLERHREDLQRQVASLDSQLALTCARLEDAGSENSSLGQRLAIERNRVTELEGLLAGMRAREYKSDLSSTKSGSQVALWQERNRILEEQVSTMQLQVQGLQKGRDATERELARLRSEALMLAAASASLEQQSHDTVAMGAKDQALALRSMREERDALASQLKAVTMQMYADDSQTTGLLVRQLEEAKASREALKQELRAAKQGRAGEPMQSRMGELERAVVDLRAENDRLMRLAGSMESERGVAQKEAASLRRQLSGGAAGGGSGSGGASAAALEDAMKQVGRLQAQLKNEQAKRKQAERDFLELMESIELSGSGGANATALASHRISVLAAAMDALEAEKLSLQESMSKMRSLLVSMQEELRLIHNEYGVAGHVLQQLTDGLA